MRNRPIGLLLAAFAALAAVPSLARGGELPGKEHPITIIGSPSILKEGSRCRIDVNELATSRRQNVVTTYEGVIARADDQGVALDVIESKRTIASPASRLPFGGRLFRNVGIGRPSPSKKEQVWIPAESILSVKLAAHTVHDPSRGQAPADAAVSHASAPSIAETATPTAHAVH